MIIHGVSSDSAVIPLLVDANGRVIVSNQSPSVQNPTGTYASYANVNIAAGTSVHVIYTVPAGQRMILDHFSMRYTGTVATVILLGYVFDGANVAVVQQVSVPVTNFFYSMVTNIVLEAGYTVECQITNGTLNDDFHGRIAMRRIL